MTSTAPFSIRLATLEDAQSIANFNINMARETEDMQLIPEVILAGAQRLITDSTLGYYLVAETGSQIVGSLMVTTEWSDWRNGIFWWIQSVYVRPLYRRQGLYRELYLRVQELAEQEPAVCGFRLYVERDNTAAQRTYESRGMSETDYKMFEELQPTLEHKRGAKAAATGVHCSRVHYPSSYPPCLDSPQPMCRTTASLPPDPIKSILFQHPAFTARRVSSVYPNSGWLPRG